MRIFLILFLLLSPSSAFAIIDGGIQTNVSLQYDDAIDPDDETDAFSNDTGDATFGDGLGVDSSLWGVDDSNYGTFAGFDLRGERYNPYAFFTPNIDLGLDISTLGLLIYGGLAYGQEEQLLTDDFFIDYTERMPVYIPGGGLIYLQRAGQTIEDIDDDGFSTTITYDDLGRPTYETDGFEGSIKVDYNLSGRITGLNYSDGLSLSLGYSYSETGSLETMKITDQESQESVTGGYDSAGRLKFAESPSLNLSVQFEYDSGGIPTVGTRLDF